MNILIIIPGFIPSTIIGILRPLAALERLGEINLRLQLYNISIMLKSDIEWCDVAVFCRNCEIKDLATLYELKRKKKKIVYEVDDNFEEIPLTTAVGFYHRSFFRLHVLRRFFSLSDITRVYSDRLLERAVSHGANPQIIRGYFDKSLIEGLTKNASDGLIRIAYPSGRFDDEELEEMIFSSMRALLQKYDGRVEFHLWRKSLPRQLVGVKGVVLNKSCRSYDEFVRSFFKAGFDIGIAPGVDTPFFHSKTNNKYREFGGCGVAGVYSNFLPYANSVTHEHTGLLVNNSKEKWVATIDRLINDSDLRTELVKNAQDDVFHNYSFDSSVESWRDCLNFLKVEENKSVPRWLPKLNQSSLFVHIALSAIDECGVNNRMEYLHSAFASIPNSSLISLSVEQYHESKNYDFTAGIVFLCRKSQLEVLTSLLIGNRFIIDISTYEDNLAEAIQRIHAVTSNTLTSFLCTYEQAKKYELVDCIQKGALLSGVHLSHIEHVFSLSGYPAAYLDLVERHVHFSLKQTVHSTSRLRATSNKVVTYYNRWKGRFQTVLMWVKWRLNLRQF